MASIGIAAVEDEKAGPAPTPTAVVLNMNGTMTKGPGHPVPEAVYRQCTRLLRRGVPVTIVSNQKLHNDEHDEANGRASLVEKRDAVRARLVQEVGPAEANTLLRDGLFIASQNSALVHTFDLENDYLVARFEEPLFAGREEQEALFNAAKEAFPDKVSFASYDAAYGYALTIYLRAACRSHEERDALREWVRAQVADQPKAVVMKIQAGIAICHEGINKAGAVAFLKQKYNHVVLSVGNQARDGGGMDYGMLQKADVGVNVGEACGIPHRFEDSKEPLVPVLERFFPYGHDSEAAPEPAIDYASVDLAVSDLVGTLAETNADLGDVDANGDMIAALVQLAEANVHVAIDTGLNLFRNGPFLLPSADGAKEAHDEPTRYILQYLSHVVDAVQERDDRDGLLKRFWAAPLNGAYIVCLADLVNDAGLLDKDADGYVQPRQGWEEHKVHVRGAKDAPRFKDGKLLAKLRESVPHCRVRNEHEGYILSVVAEPGSIRDEMQALADELGMVLMQSNYLAICPRDHNKGRVVDKLKELSGTSHALCAGDNAWVGGNDWELVCGPHAAVSIAVAPPKEPSPLLDGFSRFFQQLEEGPRSLVDIFTIIAMSK